jgi:small-conductance mechanosensitive channel
MRILGHLAALLIVAFISATGASAQMSIGGTTPVEATPSLPDPLTPEAANALISRLSDSEVRSLLLDQLNTQIDTSDAESGVGLSDLFYHSTTGVGENIAKSVRRVPFMVSEQGRAFSNFYERIGGFVGLIQMFGYLIVVFGAGALAEIAFRRATQNWRILPPADPDNMQLREVWQLLAQRLTTQVVSVVIFFIVARAVSAIILPDNIAAIADLIVTYLIAFPRVMLAMAFFMFAPQNPEYRLLNVDTPTAKGLCKHNFFLALALGFTGAIAAFNLQHDVSNVETRLLFWLNTFLHVYLAWVMWTYREGCITMMRGSDPDVSPTEDRIARSYPYFAIAVIFAVWWLVNVVASYGNFQLLATVPQYKTMILLLFAPAMDTMIRGVVRHFAPPMTGEGPVAERAHLAAKRSYIRIGRVIVFGIVILSIANFWGMSPESIATAGVGPRLAAAMMEFLIIMSIGYLLYELVSLYINRKLAAEQTAAGYDPDAQEVGGDGGGAGGSRLSTVLPLILGVCRATIIVVFLLLGLGNVGIDTTPLLAGAGIVGLAIGFGAQKLVTDVVSGIFFLIDDAFRTGEYVTVEGTMGTVEKISIRSMQLRHHKGPVHTIPYGEIPKITNYSRDWVIMKLRFTVPFGTDPNKVKKIFKKIGQDLLQVPEFKDDFLQPFKSQGMLEIDDIGMVFRGKFMAKPGTQFTLRKEIFNRVNAEFEANGLEFARREVRVALPSMDGADLTEEDKAAISAAATQAAQEILPEDPAAKDKQ